MNLHYFIITHFLPGFQSNGRLLLVVVLGICKESVHSFGFVSYMLIVKYYINYPFFLNSYIYYYCCADSIKGLWSFGF